MSEHFYDPEFGFLPSKVARLQEILHDYNPFLSVVFIPPRERTETDVFPYGILDSSPAHASYLVKHLTEQEMERPEEVLAWLFEGDLSKHRSIDVQDRLRLKQDAERLLKIKEQEDARQERLELSTALISGGVDGKHYYRHNGKTFRR